MSEWIGKTSAQVLSTIVRNNPQIDTVWVHGYVPAEQYLPPYYSNDLAVNRDFFRKPNWPNEALLRINDPSHKSDLGYRNPHSKFPLLRINSKVRVGQEVYHIPMMDCENPYVTDERSAIRKTKILARKLCLPEGVILKSGFGFHYIGFDLISEDHFWSLIQEVKEADDEDPYLQNWLDSNWTHVSGEEGFFSLRINSDRKQKRRTPRVVDTFDPRFPQNYTERLRPHPRTTPFDLQQLLILQEVFAKGVVEKFYFDGQSGIPLHVSLH